MPSECERSTVLLTGAATWAPPGDLVSSEDFGHWRACTMFSSLLETDGSMVPELVAARGTAVMASTAAADLNR